MERRAENRIPSNCPVRITLLGGPPESFEATLVNVSGRGARLKMDRPLECDAVVRIDLENGLMLGEVCYCASDGDGYGIGVQLEHSLLNLAEVTRMRDRVLDRDGEPRSQRTR
ncbi:MAG: PilZ domain-containing protein [Acidobacteriota bacterium]